MVMDGANPLGLANRLPRRSIHQLVRFLIMKLKTQTILSQSMAEAAAAGVSIRVDPDLILPVASQNRIVKAMQSLGCIEGKDYAPGEKSKGYGYTLWMTDETALKLIPIWKNFLCGSAAEMWTDDKAQDVMWAVRKYSELYPVTLPAEIETSKKGGDIMDLLQIIQERIEDHGIGLRKSFPPETVRLYTMFLAERRSGRCPISHQLLIDVKGNLLEGAEVDHFYSRSYVGVNGGWIIRSEENKKLRDPAYRAAINTRFLTFQDELAQWMKDRHGAELDFESKSQDR